MCCGVLPIDQMRDHISPVTLVMTRVPKKVLETFYKIHLPPSESPKYTTSIFLQVFASKKGWKTGSGTPAEMHAAKVVMKDFTTGKLLHCELRPDYDLEKHGFCMQNGFRMDLTGIEPSAQNYEEVKMLEDVAEHVNDDEEMDEQTSMINTTVTTMQEEETKQPTKAEVRAAAGAQQYMQAENDFDEHFFKSKVPKAKLNKGEKRALKFAQK